MPGSTLLLITPTLDLAFRLRTARCVRRLRHGALCAPGLPPARPTVLASGRHPWIQWAARQGWTGPQRLVGLTLALTGLLQAWPALGPVIINILRSRALDAEDHQAAARSSWACLTGRFHSAPGDGWARGSAARR